MFEVSEVVSLRRVVMVFGVLALVAFALSTATAQVGTGPIGPQLGSSNPISLVPSVQRPRTHPCVVNLFSNVEFANFTPKSFSYAPPSGCPGPWAKVVLNADFEVTAGVQYDRTAAFYIGHANIFYGTTAEPGSNFSPEWHIERDITDLTPILMSAQTGEANIGNVVYPPYTGVIYSSAAIEYYPAGNGATVATTPDVVIPVNGGGGDAGTLNNGANRISASFTPPTNVEQVYLDVIAQSQSNDEFWYTCVPNDVAIELENCGNTGFRETQVYIDGTLAGIAPVTPWIYTGGIDPYLWVPITGAQTLNFEPYRVNLTPFAATLNDGNEHTVAVAVYNADDYFLATANLLLYEDHGSTVVSGSVSTNTLSAPVPDVSEDLSVDESGDITGSVDVTAGHNFTVSGTAHTSHGVVTTTVAQTANFYNDQNFDDTNSGYLQQIAQNTAIDSTTTTTVGNSTEVKKEVYNYGLNMTIDYVVNNDGSAQQLASSGQDFTYAMTDNVNGKLMDHTNKQHLVDSTDTLLFNTQGNFIGNQGMQSKSRYLLKGFDTGCYDVGAAASNNVLSTYTVIICH